MAVRMPLVELGLYSKDLEDDIKDIVENLEDEGEFIEPIHLQVVCQRWWRQRLSTNRNIEDNVFRDNNISDVDKALEEFYENAVRDAILETKVTEKDIREWCEYKLITSTETRGIVHQSADSTDGMPNKVVEILDKEYLIRPELRSGEVWYELTHDRLIKPIKNSNMRWREKERKRKSRRNRLIIIPSGDSGSSRCRNYIGCFIWSSSASSRSTYDRHLFYALASKYRSASSICSC